MRRKKGFTLTELVIVIAIFGVLLGIITPAWARYLQRSKIKAQNAKAKAVFNAVQTAVTDLDFAERKYYAAISQENAKNRIYTPTDGSDWYYYWNGSEGFQCSATGVKRSQDGMSATQKATIDEWDEKLGNQIKRIADEEIVFKIWIHDYKVVAVATAASANNRYIGAHPVTMFELRGQGVDTDPIENTNVAAVDLKWYDLDTTNNPT